MKLKILMILKLEAIKFNKKRNTFQNNSITYVLEQIKL